jgi:hypothetical protein
VILLPTGFYRARIAQRGWDKSKNGVPQYVVEFAVTQGRALDARLLMRMNFSDAGAGFAVERLRRLGWRGYDLATLHEEPLADEHTIEVSHREHEGKTYADVDVVLWIPKPHALAPEQLANLATRMRGVIAKTDRLLGLPEQPADEPVREPGSDDADDFA